MNTTTKSPRHPWSCYVTDALGWWLFIILQAFSMFMRTAAICRVARRARAELMKPDVG